MWLTLALVSSLLLAVRRIFEKQLSAELGNFSLGALMQGFAILPLLVLALFLPVPEDIFQLPWDFWWPLIIIWALCYPLQTYFLYRSLREGELSEVMPVSALLPVFNIASSFVLLGELPTSLGFVGIAATVLGVSILLAGPHTAQRLRFNMPVLFMVVSILITAIGSSLDKIAIEASTPVFYSLANNIGAMLVLLALAWAYREQGMVRGIRKHFALLSFSGVLLAIAFVTFTAAFLEGPTSYVLAIRSGGFILAAFWGMFALREKMTLRKGIAIVLFVAGTAALSLA